MGSTLTGVKVAVLGGDDRELVLVSELVRMGADISVVGNFKLAETKGIQYYSDIREAVRDAKFIILPMPGIDEKGVIRSKYSEKPLALNKEILQSFREDSVIIVGTARLLLKELSAHRGIKLIEIADIDEVAILNSIPSAEGAIQMAMEATDITIHGSNTFVLGFGRCGATLARMVFGLGAKTFVVARKPKDIARIIEMGMEALTFAQLPDYISKADIIFNTVPCLVLDRYLLEKVKRSAYICDIASSPGGVDFDAARRLSLKAELAPPLPGKVAPKTAGLILAKIIPYIIINELGNTSSLSIHRDCR